MSLPGTTIELVDSAPARSAPTSTSAVFVVGQTEKGAVGPQLVTSIAQYVTKYGARVAYGALYDWLDAFFRSGGGTAYVSRVIGVAPVLATRNLVDAGVAVSLVANAKSYGTWGNAISVGVAAGGAGGTFVIFVQYNGVEVERSGDLVDTTAAVAWAANSSYISLVQGASTNDPAVAAAAALSGGTDDHANATEGTWKNALDLFPRDLGPGQVVMPARTTDTAHTNLLNHAAANNRFALLDLVDSGTAATLLTDATDARNSNARWGATFAPWAVIPGIVRDTTRTVPWSAIEAGLIANRDAFGQNPNVPAAGDLGESLYAIDLSQPAWSDADREALNDAGVNVAIRKYGRMRAYGFRSLANPDSETNYIEASNMRLIMAVTAEADVIAEHYLFRVIDGAGHLFADFKGDLTGMLMPYYDAGALFGLTPADAFYVDVGPQVNTPETIQAQELHAVLSLRISGFSEVVVIQIVKRAVTETVA